MNNNPVFIDNSPTITADDILKARLVISDPGDWTQGKRHRTESRWFGLRTHHSYCALGAIDLSCGGDTLKAHRIEFFLNSVATNMGFPWGGIMDVNDQTDHQTTLSVFDEAVKLKRAEEAQFEAERKHISQMHKRLQDQLTLNGLDFQSDITHEEMREILHHHK